MSKTVSLKPATLIVIMLLCYYWDCIGLTKGTYANDNAAALSLIVGSSLAYIPFIACSLIYIENEKKSKYSIIPASDIWKEYGRRLRFVILFPV